MDRAAALGRAAPLIVRCDARLLDVQAAKLMMNLINAVNALSCLPVGPMLLEHRGYRAVWAAAVAEALACYEALGVRPRPADPRDAGKVKLLGYLLRLPQCLFVPATRSNLRGRGGGKTSMAQDLDA